MRLRQFWDTATDGKRWRRAMRRSTAVRAAVSTGLCNMGTAYASGQSLKPLVGATAFAILGTIITKTFDEDLQAEPPANPPADQTAPHQSP